MDMEETTTQPPTRGREPGRDWRELHVVFFVLPIILTLLIPTGAILYLYGRLSWHPGLVIMGYYPAGIFMIACFFMGIVRLLQGWRKCTWKGRLVSMSQVGVPIMFVVLFIIPPYVPIESPFWPGATPFTHGLRDRIKSKADLPTIRSWLRTFDKEDYDVHGNRIPLDQQPESLRVLNSRRVSLCANKDDKPEVRITWGGAIFHWGLAIGLEDMEIPSSVLDDEYEAWLLVEPGVYVYDW